MDLDRIERRRYAIGRDFSGRHLDRYGAVSLVEGRGMKTAKKMRIASCFVSVISLCACDGGLWGPRQNPRDPESEIYQGYTTVTRSSDIAPAYPGGGSILSGWKLTISSVIGATAYELKIAATPAGLDADPFYDEVEESSNTIDVSEAELSPSTTYYWTARARIGGSWDSVWSPVYSMNTDSTWPWRQYSSAMNDSWSSIASSEDGSRIAAAAAYYGIYTSANSGLTWENSFSTDYGGWAGIACSADGRRIAACNTINSVITSSNFGDNWANHSLSGYGYYHSALASSADGTRLAIAIDYGKIWLSKDSGATWTSVDDERSRVWRSIAASGDFSRIFAAEQNGNLWTSSDSGAHWNPMSAAGLGNWYAIASCAGGTRLAAAEYEGFICTSTDSGASWTPCVSAGARDWVAITSSDDGERLAAAEGYGYVWVSNDSGLSWTRQDQVGLRVWRSVELSGDGQLLIAGPDSGYPWVRPLAATGFEGKAAASSSDILPLSPREGAELAGTTLRFSKVAGAVEYQVVVASSVAGLDSSPLYTAESTTNRMDVGPALRFDTSTYYWKARARTSGVWDSSWSPAASFTTKSKWLWKIRTPAARAIQSLTMGANGIGLAVATSGGRILTSCDFGVAWIDRGTVGPDGWIAIASSADCSKLAAIPWSNGYVWTSDDSGAHWVERTSSGYRGWHAIASDADGSHLGASDTYFAFLTSADSGTSWTDRSPGTSINLRAIASSSDGARLAAIGDYSGDSVWTSDDYGASWAMNSSTDFQYLRSVASNSDGTRLALISEYGKVLILSDTGGEWSSRILQVFDYAGRSISMSGDGTRILAISHLEGLKISMDSGASWGILGLDGSNCSYQYGAISADGTRCAIIDDGDRIWLAEYVPN
jgi:hypothetical protein